MQFYQQAAIVEKGIGIKDYPYSRLDVVSGLSLHRYRRLLHHRRLRRDASRAGVAIESAADAAEALRPLLGLLRRAVRIRPLQCVAVLRFVLPPRPLFGVRGVRLGNRGQPAPARGAALLRALHRLIALGAAVVSCPCPLVRVMYLSQVANGVLLPIVWCSCSSSSTART